jgi:hypothetical protein
MKILNRILLASMLAFFSASLLAKTSVYEWGPWMAEGYQNEDDDNFVNAADKAKLKANSRANDVGFEFHNDGSFLVSISNFGGGGDGGGDGGGNNGGGGDIGGGGDFGGVSSEPSVFAPGNSGNTNGFMHSSEAPGNWVNTVAAVEMSPDPSPSFSPGYSGNTPGESNSMNASPVVDNTPAVEVSSNAGMPSFVPDPTPPVSPGNTGNAPGPSNSGLPIGHEGSSSGGSSGKGKK